MQRKVTTWSKSSFGWAKELFELFNKHPRKKVWFVQGLLEPDNEEPRVYYWVEDDYLVFYCREYEGQNRAMEIEKWKFYAKYRVELFTRHDEIKEQDELEKIIVNKCIDEDAKC